MSRRKRKPEPNREMHPEEAARRERERRADSEAWRRGAEQERQEGLGAGEAGGRWLTAVDTGRRYQPRRDWRSKPTTPEQTRALRARGLNPLRYRTRGEASDELAGTGEKRGRRR
jgi:hypothetical protein